MYLEAGLIFRLILLPFFHFLSIFFFWDKIGVYVFFIAWFPLIINTVLFSSPFLNYIAMLMFSICTLMSMHVPIEPFLYDNVFLGIQMLTLCVTIAVSIFQNKVLPQNSVTKQKHIDRLLRYKDNIVVEYDVKSHTIIAISNTACRAYQWNRRYILGKPLTTIQMEDFLSNPPVGFWAAIEKKNIWHGFTDVVMKNKTVCEERAYFRAYRNRCGEIVSIEKKVVEILIKTESNFYGFQYNIFFDNSPMPMAIINKNHVIEKANASFIKDTPSKPVFNYSKFGELFMGIQQKQQIMISLNAAFNGEKSSFITDFESVEGYIYSEYIFVPHFDPRHHKVSHVLFLLRKINPQAFAIDKHKLNVINTDSIEIFRVLRQSLTELYSKIPDNQLKVFGNSLPVIKGSCELWKKLCDSILMFALKEGRVQANITTISCNSIKKQHFFKVSFNSIFYQDLSNIEHSMTMKILKKVISLISSDIVFIKGKTEELVLTFSIQE